MQTALANKFVTLTLPGTISLTLQMPLQTSFPTLWLFAAASAILGTVFLLAAFMELRARRRRGHIVVSLALGIILATATVPLAIGAYQQYATANTWTYTYRLDVLPNETAPEALILPIPGDHTLLASLRLVAGHANWSFTDTPHGRGLYIRIAGAATLEAVHSEFPASAVRRNSTLTMINSSIPYFPAFVWIFYSGTGLAHIEFEAGGSALPQSESVRPGWRLYQLLPPPVP